MTGKWFWPSDLRFFESFEIIRCQMRFSPITFERKEIINGGRSPCVPFVTPHWLIATCPTWVTTWPHVTLTRGHMLTLTSQGLHVYSTHLDEWNTMASELLRQLYPFNEKRFGEGLLFWTSWLLGPRQLKPPHTNCYFIWTRDNCSNLILLRPTRKTVFGSPPSFLAHCQTVTLPTNPQLAWTRHRASSPTNHAAIRHLRYSSSGGVARLIQHPAAAADDSHWVTAPCNSTYVVHFIIA